MRQLRRQERCLNCGEPVGGDFCGSCGQENTDYRVSLRRLGGDLFEELFQLESRLWRSLWMLVRRPGLLTIEYNAGRRVRYTTPPRLYLMASVAYFALVTLMPPAARIELGDDEQVEADVMRPQPDDSAWQRRLRERLVTLRKTDPKALSRQVGDALHEQLPKAMALLVPAFALLSWLLFRRPRLFFVEHLVLALHVHAFAFLALLLARLTRMEALLPLAAIGAWLWMLLAMRRVFCAPWWRTFVNASLVGIAYGLLLLTVIGGIALATLWLE